MIPDINDHRPNGFYERNPDLSATQQQRRQSITQGSLSGPRNPHLSDDDRSRLADVLETVRHTCAVRGILIKANMKNFDTSHRGIVTQTRFKREMSNCFPALPSADIDLLAKAYSTEDGEDVKYMLLHKDVTPGAGGNMHDLYHTLHVFCFRLLCATADDGDAGVGSRGVLGTSKLASLAGTTTGHRPAVSPSKVLEHGAVPADDFDGVMAHIIRQARCVNPIVMTQ